MSSWSSTTARPTPGRCRAARSASIAASSWNWRTRPNWPRSWAHEVVHAAAKHGANRFQRQLLFGLAGLGVALAADDSKHARAIVGASNLGFHLAGQKFGRNQERISDYHGMKYMHGAGYDTSAAVTLQQKFVALAEGRNSSWLEGLFASHPPSPERVANNRAALAEFPPGRRGGRSPLPGAHGGAARRPRSLRPRRPSAREHRPELRPCPAPDRPGDRPAATRIALLRRPGRHPRKPGPARRRRAVLRRRDRKKSRLLRALPGSRFVTGHLGARAHGPVRPGVQQQSSADAGGKLQARRVCTGRRSAR